MTPEEMSQLLDELEQRLGPKADVLLRLGAQYKVTDALVGIGLGAALAIGALIVGAWVYRREYRDSFDASTARPIAVIFGGLVFVLGLAMVAVNIPVLMNPEYAAIRDLVAR